MSDVVRAEKIACEVDHAARQLVQAGRLDLPGRPVSFRTTDTFLRVFGLSSLADLPPVHGQETETNASPTESEG